jgi:hypothetical protein
LSNGIPVAAIELTMATLRLACRRRHALAIAVGAIVVAAVPIQAPGEQSSVLVEVGVGSPRAAGLEHVFGGRSVSISTVLHGAAGARADLKARLFQITPALAAPVGESLDVASGVDFIGGLRRLLTFDVAIPPVERESRFEVVVFVRVHPAADWRRSGSVSLHVHPSDLLKPLRRWTEDRPLRLRDPSGKLEHFLTAQRISFLDPNARSLERPDHPVVTLVVGGTDDLALARRRAERGEAVILFRERASAFPRIDRTGSLLIVELELLDRLPMDPLAQKLFLELVESTRSGETNGQEEDRHERQDLR